LQKKNRRTKILSIMYLAMNAWNEILARIFTNFRSQENVSPEWLINPATRRRLKLDRYYPDAGIAIRFIGLTAKGQGRQSDWEVMETEQRDQTRAELCRQNGVQLVLIDPEEDPIKQLDQLLRGLAGASRTLAQSNRPLAYKQEWMPLLSAVRDKGTQLRTLLVKQPEQMMSNLAESWRDREAGFSIFGTESSTPVNQPAITRKAPPLTAYVSGQRVRHTRFGDGVITNIAPQGEDLALSILFDGAQERTFLASLLQDKLSIVT
jgi:hypothetical protein